MRARTYHSIPKKDKAERPQCWFYDHLIWSVYPGKNETKQTLPNPKTPPYRNITYALH